MVRPAAIVKFLADAGVSFVAGVPDSVLEGFCHELSSNDRGIRHLVACNEGAAIALATGWHIGTGSIPVVYMQNSGLGNAINPLSSVVASDVFGIPMLLLVGWRGQPGHDDEPQHRLSGLATRKLLDALGVGSEVLPGDESQSRTVLEQTLEEIRGSRSARALLVERGLIGNTPVQAEVSGCPGLWTSSDALKRVCRRIPKGDLCVSTVGFISRFLAAYREESGENLATDLLVVGGMGLASQIALGLALSSAPRRVWCLDGDGAALMHLGALAAIGSLKKTTNFIHVLFNNGIHESVGGMPTANPNIDFLEISRACGYGEGKRISNEEELDLISQWLSMESGPHFLELLVSRNSTAVIPRPKMSPKDNKILVMSTLGTHHI
jgi:phosphonopyruvate decarboxylase